MKYQSKRRARDRARQRGGSTALLPASEVRRLRRQGINITRRFLAPAVTLDDYRDLGRRLEAKAARVDWQSGGIRQLRGQVATLQARIDTLPAMQERELSEKIGQLNSQLLVAQQRILALEADSIIQGAPRVYADYLEEEGEEP